MDTGDSGISGSDIPSHVSPDSISIDLLDEDAGTPPELAQPVSSGVLDPPQLLNQPPEEGPSGSLTSENVLETMPKPTVTESTESKSGTIQQESEIHQADVNLSVQTAPESPNKSSPVEAPPNISSYFCAGNSGTDEFDFMRTNAVKEESSATEQSKDDLVQETPSEDTEALPKHGLKPSTSFSLPVHDIDRAYDAWLPPAATKTVLLQAQRSKFSGISADMLTFPGVSKSDSLGDPVTEFVKKYKSESEASQRKVLTVNDVTADMPGVRALIKAECWRAAVQLTANLLTGHGQGPGKAGSPSKHSPDSLKLWACRLALLVKLKMYNEAETEMKSFGHLDNPDLYYDFYHNQYPRKTGSMVPFEMRLLHAALPGYLDRKRESIDRLYSLKGVIDRMLHNLNNGLPEDGGGIVLSEESRQASITIWERRLLKTMYLIAGCFNGLKDYRTTCRVYEAIMEIDKENSPQILCSIGRIHLQIGNTELASKYFEKARYLFQNENTKLFHDHLNSGYLNIAKGEYNQAYNSFMEAQKVVNSDDLARCNGAVSSLYGGQLKVGLVQLEELVYSNPEVYLQTPVLINLCTLYEMESAHALSKKLNLLGLAGRDKGDGFDVTALKLS